MAEASRGGTGNGTGNRILDALPAAEFEAVSPSLEPVELEVRDHVFRRGEPIEFVHFPVNCVISLVSEMENGRVVEVASVGREGMVGLPTFLEGSYTSALESFSQVPGTSLRLPAERFAALTDGAGVLQKLLERYTQALFVQVAQSSACNRLHTLEQRCARWLLQTEDRIGAPRFPLTQEFLAQMLGVQRSSVNTAAGALQQHGVIRYSRGVITILDRPGLETLACECYRVSAAEYARLIP